MASSMPLPIPPRTPTPPPEDLVEISTASTAVTGLGLDGVSTSTVSSPTKHSFEPDALSPMRENFPTTAYRNSSITSHLSSSSANSPTIPFSPPAPYSPHDSGTFLPAPSADSPFNFQSTTLSKSPITRTNVVGQRRGHKYKHSSVSHAIFLEPPPRPALSLPASLPIPTLKECRASMTPNQRHRSLWSLTHFLVAAYIWSSAQGSLALTALSHLILFDALGATVCVAVDVLSNFEVWKRSSIRHPFGLQRAEVLAGTAMSIFLLFMGMDLISHNLTHVLESISHPAAHASHHAPHQRVSPGSVDLASLIAIVSTLISALALGNHARIGKAMRISYLTALPSILSNPSHFLTLSCSALLLLLPLLSIDIYIWLDRLLSSTIAVAMCLLGVRLTINLASMLLMSYDPTTSSSSSISGGAREQGDVQGVVRDIALDPLIASVEEARFWQVHYGLCLANLKVTCRQREEDVVARLRERIASLVKNRLGGGYGGGGQAGIVKWEVSVEVRTDGRA